MMDVSGIKQYSENTKTDRSIGSAVSMSGKTEAEIVKADHKSDDRLSDNEVGYALDKYDISFSIKSEDDPEMDIERNILEDDDIVPKENDFIKLEADIYQTSDNSFGIAETEDSFFTLDCSDKIGKEYEGSFNSSRNSGDISNEIGEKAESSFDYGDDTDSYDEDYFGNKVNIIIKKEVKDDLEDEIKPKVIDYGRKTKKAKEHVCEICNKAFTSDNRVKRHKEQLHVDGSNENTAIREGKYICKFCNKRFISQSRLNLHIVTHTGVKPFSCDVCGQKFSHPTNKRRHMKTHTGDKPFVCVFCGKSFPVKHYLTDHLVKHTGEKPHECKLCSMTFAHRFSLKQHELLKHPGGELNFQDSYKDRPFTCDVCGKGFTQQSSLKIHNRLHTGSKPYKCSECDASFIRSDTLMRHKLEHSGQRPYQCDMCDKAFTSGYVLKQHRNVHTGDRRQQCEHCGIELANKESLTRHMLRHTGESMLECGTCHRRFVQEQTLRKHQEHPCEEKIYECRDCDYKNCSESKLKRHMLKHNGQKLLECKICKHKFTYPSNLKRHMKVHEKDHVRTQRKETLITDDSVEHFIAVSVQDIIDIKKNVDTNHTNRKAGKRTKKVKT
ncbi:zinc finger protein ZFP2-like [Ruditapes philippinarum]|uniref:zinc finger protein ZFP2-like n=1 Tax=Ruditapes philippinarum TaxID=129788 RepID=UPI00295C3325|nr:zinc finger protein ZFP2-like [Ruditapes philippinarum]